MTKLTMLAQAGCGVAVLATMLGYSGLSKAEEKIRVGWQTTWAVQGQLVMGLMHTDIGKWNGLDLEFNGFSYGGPLNAAAIGGAVDVVLTADQPALVLLDRSDDFAIVGRLMYNRVCIYAPAAGNVSKIVELAGKRVSGPVGAAAERVALEHMQRSGVDIKTVTLGNLDMAQQSAMLLAAGARASKWIGVDALYGFDPLPAEFEVEGYAKILECDRVVSVVMMRKSTLLKDLQKATDFMCAFTASWQQYASDKRLLNDLFLQESGLTVSHEVLDASASLEPNFEAKSSADFRFDFDESDFAVFESANRFLVERGILKAPLNLSDHLELGPLKAALNTSECTDFKAELPYAANR